MPLENPEQKNNEQALLKAVLYGDKQELKKFNHVPVGQNHAGDVNMKEVYGVDINLDNELSSQLNLNNSKSRSPDDFVLIHPPTLERVDSKLSSLVPFDGYGADIRPRLSEKKTFSDKTKNPDLLHIYKGVRNQTQIPYQQLKSSLQQAQDNRKLEQGGQEPVSYANLPRRDLAYVLSPNFNRKQAGSLFDGDLNDKWEKKTDSLYRKLLKLI